ncbi:MAG: MarR family transcriptional regulator [Lachnospiraceae bacterium]|nr:MarR family transcriptional regulator [Lachnospiraceae bacterium]
MDHEKKIGIQIRNTNNIIRRVVTNQPTSKLMDKLTGTNTWLLAYIGEQTDKGIDVFQRDIEENFGITRSCVSKVITLMEQKGFIERKEVEHDARLKKLVLTEEAAKYAAKMREDSIEMEKKITAGFSDEEKDKLLEFLDRIVTNLEKDL